MNTADDEFLARAAFAQARSLEPTEADVARVLTRVRLAAARPPRRRTLPTTRRRLVLTVAATALIVGAGGYAAVPPLRAAIDGAADTFSGWIAGNSDSAPGRPLGATEQAPAYFRDPRYASDPRVIAEADGYKLLAARAPDGSVSFDLGDTGVGLGGYTATSFGDGVLIVLGPGSVSHADEHGHVPLFGITAQSVRSVELTYASGPPLRVDGIHGGFVLLAEPARAPREIVALDAAGKERGRTPIDNSPHQGSRIDWTQYGPPAPRVPTRCLPGAAGLHPPPGCPNR
ncbi:MAG: hypothetical protein QOG68_1475 [Solirubrobacteraceae bacterium]|nr:hypothetical protein [Solirubrobacteraceae bacterium]